MLRLLPLALIGAALALPLDGHALGAQTPSPSSIANEFSALHMRSIGPAQMSGRIADISGFEANPAIFYVGSSHGGVWKTTNNGATFTPEFQDDGLMSVGALRVSQKDPNLVWLGTGESNNRQSTSWGSGVWKSTDGGATWKNMGLTKSYTINRIVMDPDNNDIVFVAATGNLFGPGGDRGIYKTTDGGGTWKLVLKGDENTGGNDLAMAFSDKKTIYASLFQRQRSQCCMNGGGPGSGIWKSIDEGETWTHETSGLPPGDLGRIALDVYRKNPNIVYAEVATEAGGGGAGGRGGGGGGRGGAAAPVTGPPPKPVPPGTPSDGIYRSDDGGVTWVRTANDPDNRPMYFSQVRVDPNNQDRILVASVRLYLSSDGGKTFAPVDAAVHDDKHAIWWDPNNSSHFLTGGDGGAYQTWDLARSWIWFPNLPVPLFYHVDYDLSEPYNVCGGLQDNYDWCGPSAVRSARGITNDRWQTVQGGDGFETIIDKRDANVVYTESQDGGLTRRNKLTGESRSIRPTPANTTDSTGAGAYRFQWDTPVALSPHDPGILYVGGNKLFKSTDKGDHWTAISPDLSSGANRPEQIIMGVRNADVHFAKEDGIVSWGDITTFAESPKVRGVFYAGTDDGIVSLSKDGGKTWDKTLGTRMPGLPKGAWISKVVPSRFDGATVYISNDGHRLNDYDTHMWVSNDYGATFRSLNGNLSGESVKTMTEDVKNPDVLYIGTETGIFLTLDRGKSWQRLALNFPTVRTDEITLMPRDNAMIVATHGRGVWILDYLSPIQEYTQATQGTADAKLFTPSPALQYNQWNDRNQEFWGHQYFVGENPPTEAVLQMYFKKSLTDVKLKITDTLGKQMRELVVPANKLVMGIQTVCWDQRVDPIDNAGAAGGAAFAGRAGGAPGGGGAGAPPDSAAAAALGGRGGRGGGAGGGGRGGRGGGGGAGGTGPIPQPTEGYLPTNPCGGGGGRGGGGGGGGGAASPLVLPGVYNVALMVDGKTVETKQLKIVADPMNPMTVAERKRYYDVTMDLHQMQGKGEKVATVLTALDGQMTAVSAAVKDSKAPASVKTSFDAFKKEYASVCAKFGIGTGGGGGGRGGRGGGGGGRGGAAGGGGAGAPASACPAAAARRGGAAAIASAPADTSGAAATADAAPADQANIYGRVAALKTEIVGFTEAVTPAQLREYNELKLAFPTTLASGNAFIAKAATMSTTLKKYDITLTVPPMMK